MSKYDALRDHLRHQRGDVRLTLEEIANIVPGGLPTSAYRYEMWWHNNDSSHMHSRSWGDAGYDAVPDLLRRLVDFRQTSTRA